MPVIIEVPRDPTDFVLQGEKLRMSIFDEELPNWNLAGIAGQVGFSSVLQDEDAFTPMNAFVEINRVSIIRNKTAWLVSRNNAGIATPTGAWVRFDYQPLLNPSYWHSGTWSITGVTRDSAGAALGNCRVIVLEPGQIFVGGKTVVTQTISDGSGNYTVQVPQNTAYQIISYKDGSPDVAGISVDTLTPV